MAETDIRALNIKPDLKRAMLHVAGMRSQAASAVAAESLADLMQQAHVPSPTLLAIWQYKGGTEWLTQSATTSIDIKSGCYFGVQSDRAFVNNCWIPLAQNTMLLRDSTYVEDGDATRLNILNSQRRNKEYG